MAALAGCAANGSKYEKPPRTPLEQRIHYLEIDRHGKTHSISSISSDTASRSIDQVPAPAAVDLDSTVQISILTDTKADKAGAARSGSGELDALLKKKEQVAAALQALDRLVEARRKTVEAYRQPDKQAFFDARVVSDKLTNELIDQLTAIWKPGTEEYTRLGAGAYDRPRFAKLQAFLNEQLTSIKQAQVKIEGNLKTRSRTLSLEAFLISTGKQPSPIHLVGYDSLEDRALVRTDRLGLDLPPDERKALDAHIAANQRMASTLEQLRTGEAKLDEALRSVAAEMSPEIQAFASEAEQLYARLNAKALEARRKATRERVDAAVNKLQELNKLLSQQARAALIADSNNFLKEASADFDQVLVPIQAWMKDAKRLKDGWDRTPAGVTNMIADTVQAAKAIETSKGKLVPLLKTAETRVGTLIDKLGRQAAQKESELLESEELRALREDLETYYADFNQAYSLVTGIAASLGRLGVPPMAEMPPSTSLAFDVPEDKAQNTSFNLERTPRRIGDTVVLKATLKEGAKEVGNGKAEFRVDRFGYYAELSPAVVLVKPDQLAGGDDGFRFAPTLSWMQHWVPRPEDRSVTATVFNALDPALGLHTAFTNFTTPTSTQSVQIGIGLTLSLWKDRLQFGWGYNLMANSADEGRRYFFIGSDLIGLLQAVGLAKP